MLLIIYVPVVAMLLASVGGTLIITPPSLEVLGGLVFYNWSAYSGPATFKIAKVVNNDVGQAFIVSTYLSGSDQLVLLVSVALRTNNSFCMQVKRLLGSSVSDYSIGYDSEYNIYLKRASGVNLGSVHPVMGTSTTYYRNTRADSATFTPVTIE